MAAMNPQRQTLERQLELARAFMVERIDAQSRAQQEFARTNRPLKPRGNDEFELQLYNDGIEEYNNARNELERKRRSAEQATSRVEQLERQIEELSDNEDHQQQSTFNDNQQGPLIQEVSSSSGSGDEQANYIVDTSSDEENNQQVVLNDQVGQRRNPRRLVAISGPVTVTGAVAIGPVNAMAPLETNNHSPQIDASNVADNNLSLVPYIPENIAALPDDQPAQQPEEEPVVEPDAEAGGEQPRQEGGRNGIFRDHQVDKKRFSPYKKYWKDVATLVWKNQSEDHLVAQCRDATLDYQRFEGEDQFARIEEVIAQKLFGINERQAQRAVRVNSLLMSYSKAKRKIVRNVRHQLEIIGGKSNLEMQAVPFIIRSDKDVRKRLLNSQMGCVFRVKCRENPRQFKFVDGEARTYHSWKNFIETNNLPKAMMCYISDGFLRRGQAPNPMREVDIKFCETPACSIISRGKEKVQSVVNWVSPIATLGLFWSPVGWIGYGLYAATIFVMGYAALRQGYAIYDKYKHDESYAMDVIHLIATLGTVVIQKALPVYLKSVAKAHRDLTKLESTIITAFLCGMSGNQVVSFIGMTYTFCTKPQLTSLDVLNFVVACQNAYCCWISPKFAKDMLEQVRRELANEQHRKLAEDQAKEDKLKSEIAELERKSNLEDEKEKVQEIQEQITKKKQNLEQCMVDQKLHQSEFQSYKSEHLELFRRKEIEVKDMQQRLDELKSQLKTLTKNSQEAAVVSEDIKNINLELNNQHNEMLSLQQQHQQEVKNRMKDEGAKAKYQEFLDDETKKSSPKIDIDQNGRIIQAMFEMDAELVFKVASNEQSTIRFSNGEKLDLNINNQFDIHPRAIKQLDRVSTTGSNIHNTKTDLENVFAKTKSFNEQKMGKTEYLSQIRETLSPYGMISRAEITAVSDQMKLLEGTTGWKRVFQTSRFDNLPPAEALRLRNTVESIRSDDKTSVFEAAELLAGKLGYSDVHRLADCMKIVDTTIHNKMELFEQQWQEMKNVPEDKTLNSICREIFDASEKEISLLQKNNFSKEAVKSLATQQLKQLGKHSDSLAEEVENKLREVERKYFGENSSLPFCHPLSGVSHEMDYGPKTAKSSVNMSQIERDDASIKNFFKNKIFGKATTLVSQDGLTVSRTWRRTDGYFKQKTTSFASKDDLNPKIHYKEASAYVLKLIVQKKNQDEFRTEPDSPSRPASPVQP